MSTAPTTAPSASTVLADPQFHALPPDEQVKALSHIDSNFAGLPPEEQQKVLGASRPQLSGSLPEAPVSSTLPGPVREGILGLAAGAGIPETQDPLGDLAKGVTSAFALPTAESPADERAAGILGPLGIAAYRASKGLVKGTYKAGGDIGEGLYRGVQGDPGGYEMAAHGAGQLVGTAATLGLGRKVPEVEGVVPKPISSGTRILAQEVAGAGKEPVLAAEQARNVAVARQEGSFEARTQAAADANKQAMAQHQAKVDAINATHQEKLQSAKADYDLAVEEHKRAAAVDKAAYADKVSKMRQDWVEKAYAAEKAADDTAKVQGQRDTLQRGQDAYAKSILDNVKQTHDTVRQGLDQRWDAVREKVGIESPTDATPVFNAIQEAKVKDLRGAPGAIKQFSDLLSEIGLDAQIDTEEGPRAVPGEATLPWQTARVHYSAIGDKLSAGDLPGNVYQALKRVQKAQDSALQSAADNYGAGEDYRSVKADEHQFQSDWKDMSAVATGGSPLARVVQAEDPGFVAQAVLGKAGDRLISTLAKYREAGANPALMAKLRQLNESAKSLPTVKIPTAPKRLAIPPPPEAAPAPEMKAVKAPNIPPPPTPKTVLPPEPIPAVNPKEVRLRKLEQAAGRPFRWYDLFPPYLAEHLLLKNPKVRDWIASQPRQELPPRGQ